MAIRYQKLFTLLKENGWTTYKIRKEKLIGQGTLTALRSGTGGLDSKTLNRLCEILRCQPGDLMDYVPTWVEKRIAELTEQREEELRKYHIEHLDYDELYQRQKKVFYEKTLPKHIQRLKSNPDYSTEFIDIVEDIVSKYDILEMTQEDWDDLFNKPDPNYPSEEDETMEDIEMVCEISDDIENTYELFFKTICDDFWFDVNAERVECLKDSIKHDLDEAKLEIEKQAFEEYYSE